MKLSEQIRHIMKTSPIPRRHVARLTGIDCGNLAGFVGGHRGLGLEALDKLGEVYGLSVTHDPATVAENAATAPKGGRGRKPGAKRK